jgi:dinuclear metal center YbgI/SA1388 family protein
MILTIKDITNYLETIAPLSYQESYDNAGLVVGRSSALVKKVLVCLDVTEEVLEEAQAQNCNLIIAHHPILFQPLRSLTDSNHVERCITKAIKKDIAIYAIHTNLDNVLQGVNQRLGAQLGLQQLQILLPKTHTLAKLTTYVPATHLEPVLEALHEAGAGSIGHYSHCSFISSGEGRFMAHKLAKPYLGEIHETTKVAEVKIEVSFPKHLSQAMVHVLKKAHPYEEVTYHIQKVDNSHTAVGSGMIGELAVGLDSQVFLQHIKSKLNVSYIRHSKCLDRPIKKVAICGGAGSFLLETAKKQQADAFITADLKYHDFFNADNCILLVDIGHYESEVATKNLIYELLSEKFTSIVFLICQTNTNPVLYCC